MTLNVFYLPTPYLVENVLHGISNGISHIFFAALYNCFSVVLQALVGPSTIKVFKTSPWPEPADCFGQGAVKAHLGKKAHVAQLNALGRHVAAAHGWQVSMLNQLQLLHPRAVKTRDTMTFSS